MLRQSYYYSFFVLAWKKIGQSFSHLENPFNTATLLIGPDIWGSLVTGLTGFHSKLETITDMTTNYHRFQLVNKTGSQQSDKRRFFLGKCYWKLNRSIGWRHLLLWVTVCDHILMHYNIYIIAMHLGEERESSRKLFCPEHIAVTLARRLC